MKKGINKQYSSFKEMKSDETIENISEEEKVKRWNNFKEGIKILQNCETKTRKK